MNNPIKLLSVLSGSEPFHLDGPGEVLIVTIPRPPAAQQPGVIIHLGLFQPWTASDTIRPLGGTWGTLVGGGTGNTVFWQVVTGTEPLNIEVRRFPESSFPPQDLRLNWLMTVHSGVDPANPHITGTARPDEDPRTHALYFLQESSPQMPLSTIHNPFPLWPNPIPSGDQGRNPSGWNILSQGLGDAVVVGHTNPRKVFSRYAVTSADVIALYPVDPPVFEPNDGRERSPVLAVLRVDPDAIPVTPLPPPGVVGATGSGSLVPEWDGPAHIIKNPLLTAALVPTPDGTGFTRTPPESTPQPVALEASFNSVGACTTAIALFPADPQFAPYEHALAFHLMRRGTEDTPTWWTGVVKDVQYENGLWRVELIGFWQLLNEDAPILIEGTNFVPRPEHPVITGFIDLRDGERQPGKFGQTWSEYYRSMYAAEPNSNWGVGPDGVFIHGPPEQAAHLTMRADSTPGILRVQRSGYVFPPYVSTWWARDPNGVPHVESTDQHGIFTPRHLMHSEFDAEENELVRPKEADYKIVAGSSSTLDYAGMCIPPLRVTELPGIAQETQFVASATVRVTVGEAGAMPTVTTTLTTGALPYPMRGES